MPKRCPMCGETKALSEYHRNRSRADGVAQYCKPCARARWGGYEARKRRDPAFNAVKAQAAARWVADNAERHTTTAARHVSKKQGDTIPSAHHAGQRWTGPALELALREDIDVRDAALLLGRSYLAVVKARQRARRDPRYRDLAGIPEARP